MKKIAISIIVSCLMLGTNAQEEPNRFKLSGGLSFSLPAYNMFPVKTGFGLDAKASWFITERLAATTDAGVSVFLATDGIAPTFLVPVRLGATYFVLDKVFVFAKGGIGLYMLKTLDNTATRKFATFSGGAGYQFNNKFDIQVSYDGYSNNKGSFAYGQLRVGYYLLR